MPNDRENAKEVAFTVLINGCPIIVKARCRKDPQFLVDETRLVEADGSFTFRLRLRRLPLPVYPTAWAHLLEDVDLD